MFGWAANKWEAAVLRAELERSDFIGWLRNPPRKEWSLTVPYRKAGEDTPVYPDLVVFRRTGDELVADLLDPHDPTRDDALPKAQGLAQYAQDHGDSFGRIELIMRDERGSLRRLDLKKASLCQKVKRFSTREELQGLYAKA
ncbi:MAG: hypothetical protein NTU88_14510 [Armatimonadetes bacterium]|nr:hypothetical protein [Armatimonadota bacterium]